MNTGLGVRPELFAPIFDRSPSLGFFEAHSENYFGDSIARTKLLELRQDYPISLHGVGLSLGRADNLDQQHLAQLKALVEQVEPMLVSEHMAWSAYAHTHLPDLLPLPLNSASFGVICAHIEQMQEALQRPILLENPSNYLLFDELQIPEADFLNAVAKRTGCGLLVDINNVYVSATNLQRDPKTYLAQLNSNVIGQYHLAGHTKVDRHQETLLIDTHNQPVLPEVWRLFEQAIAQHGNHPTLVEWDSDFPDFSVLLEQCQRADRMQATAQQVTSAKRPASREVSLNNESKEVPKLAASQTDFITNLLDRKAELTSAIDVHRHRYWVYQNNVYSAIQEYLQEVYPAVCGVVGEVFFKQMAREFIKSQPPATGNLYLYGQQFKDVVAQFDGLNALPYLADLIAYEWALHEVYFSPTTINVADRLSANDLPQQALLNTAVSFNPSVRMLDSEYPIFEIHRQSLPNYHGEVAINLQQSQDSVLVCKQQNTQTNQVITRVLNPAQSVFLKLLSQQKKLKNTIDACQPLLDSTAIAEALALVFELGLLSRTNH